MVTAGPQRGEIEAFRALYEEHAAFVWRVLRRLGVAESDVPDAVQDAFLVVHRRLPEFEGRSRLTTWLYGICARVASRRRARARDCAGEPAESLATSAPDPAALAERSRARDLLESILARMPEEQRTVFWLFEVEGLSGDEIAQALEVPAGTVRSRLRLARAAFEEAVSRLHARERSVAATALRAKESTS